MITDTKQVATINLPSELTQTNVERFQRHLVDALRDKPSEVILDCANLLHVTSKDIALLWQAHEQCVSAGAEIRLVAMSQYLVRILKTLDLYECFKRDEDQVRARLTEIVRPVDSAGATTYVNLFAASDEAADAALLAFLEFVGKLGLPQIAELELRTIFYEVATNIRTHSGLSENSPIAFSASASDSNIALIFADTGLAFDPTDEAGLINMKEAAHARKTRGFGITMFHRLADAVRYERRDGLVNVLRITKRWSN